MPGCTPFGQRSSVVGRRVERAHDAVLDGEVVLDDVELGDRGRALGRREDHAIGAGHAQIAPTGVDDRGFGRGHAEEHAGYDRGVAAGLDPRQLGDRLWPVLRQLMKGHTVAYRATHGLVGHRFPGAPPTLLLDHVGARMQARGVPRRLPTWTTARTSSWSRRRADTRGIRPGTTTCARTPTRPCRSGRGGGPCVRAWPTTWSARVCRRHGGRAVRRLWRLPGAHRPRDTARHPRAANVAPAAWISPGVRPLTWKAAIASCSPGRSSTRPPSRSRLPSTARQRSPRPTGSRADSVSPLVRASPCGRHGPPQRQESGGRGCRARRSRLPCQRPGAGARRRCRRARRPTPRARPATPPARGPRRDRRSGTSPCTRRPPRRSRKRPAAVPSCAGETTLDERVPQRHHGVAQAEVGDARVGVRLAQRQRSAQLAHRRVEIARCQDRLPQAEHRATLPGLGPTGSDGRR